MSGAAIPEGWELVKLSEVGKFQGGSGFPLNAQGKTSGIYPFFKVSDFSNDGNERSLNRANHYIDEDDRRRIGARIFPAGTIAFAKIGAAIFLERKRLIEQESCLDNNMAGYILNDSRVSRDLVLANLLQFSLGSLVASTALPAIGSGELNGISFLMPSSADEQQAIAAALSDADGVVAGLERVIAKKRLIKQGAMQDLLTARRRLPGFSGEWGDTTITEAAQVDPEALGAGTARDHRFRYISLEDVNQGVLSGWTEVSFGSAPSRARRILRSGDVLLGTVRPNLKSHMLFDREGTDWVGSTGFAVLRPYREKCIPGFLFELIMSDVIGRQIDEVIAGSNYPAISNSDVRRLKIALPSLEEQKAISGILRDMDAEIQTLEARLTKARAVKEGMMQNLLTGRVRLV